MANFIRSIREAYYRRQALKILDKWGRHHSHVNGHILIRQFEMADIYVDLYWYAPVNGMKEEVMYQRHTLKGLKEYVEHDENELLPERVATFEAQ